MCWIVFSANLIAQEAEIKSEKPKFSHERGFYEDPFTLTLTARIPNTVILYTLDGSDPIESPTRLTTNELAEILIDPASTEDRGGKTPGVIVRAASQTADYDFSKVVTHTYLFLQAVIKQEDPQGFWNDPVATYAWPGHGKPQSIDYVMDEKITENAAYKDDMIDAMTQIPSYSIVTEYEDMFGKDSGIFMNALKLGWERPVSLELLDPDGAKEFQVDAGIRIRGRYSRLSRNPKHSFRLFFREEYGRSKFEYPVFEEEGTSSFDRLDFRCAQNSSWQAENGSENTVTFLKEIFARDAQHKMGMNYTRSHYCHLYLNGMYWGLFQIQERADNNFAETYLGDDKEDYDIVKPQQDVANPTNDLLIGVSDGNLDAAMRLWDKSVAGFTTNDAYFDIQGMNPDGSRNYEKERLLDVENLIDYLLIAFYTSSHDGPIVTWEGLWGHSVRPNNFIGMYNRVEPDGFKWIVHDFEKTMYDKDDDWPLIEDDSWFSDDFLNFNPVKIHRELMQNEEYRLKFSDRVYKHFDNGGTFTTDTAYSMFQYRKSQIDKAVIAESARWSDWITWRPLQTKVHWEANVNFVMNTFVANRTGIVLGQYKSLGLYPDLRAPLFKDGTDPLYAESVLVAPGTTITIEDPNPGDSKIYYCINGSDPRLVGGGVSAEAIEATSSADILIANATIINARSKTADTWSPLAEIYLVVDESIDDLKFTELHYHPTDTPGQNSSAFEFVEIKNTGSEEVNLTGVRFTKGISYSFEPGTLPPGQFIVLASNIDSFKLKYGFYPDGQYTGQLRNSGEELELANAAGTSSIYASYKDNEPWPLAADGLGSSLVSLEYDPTGDPSLSSYWRSSTYWGGSPGEDDPLPVSAPIVINEILAYTRPPLVDAIELYNPGDSLAHIGNWFLTDNRDLPKKYQIPAGTTIGAEEYLVIRQGHYVDTSLTFDPDEFGSGFSVSSHGEEIFLFSANIDSTLLGYSDGITFGESNFGVSYGEYMNSQGETFIVSQKETTLGDENGDPLIGPVVLSEIMYHPAQHNYEYVKLKNISDSTVRFYADDLPVHTWKISGLDFAFPDNSELQSGDSLYIIESFTEVDLFREWYDIPSMVQVFNMSGSMDNAGESIAIYQPGPQYLKDTVLIHGYVLIEKVKYNDTAPWYLEADGLGASLSRLSENSFANDPFSWGESKLIPPALFADGDEDPNNNISLGFAEDANWQSSISHVSIDGEVVVNTDFIINDGELSIMPQYFPTEKDYLVKVTADNYYPAGVLQHSIAYVSIQENIPGEARFMLYPNPSNGKVYLESLGDQGSALVSIYDMQGRQVETLNWANSLSRLEFILTKPGMYIVHVTSASQIQTFKVIRD